MSVEKYRHFVCECLIHDPDKDSGLRDDEMFGLYLSWCDLNRKQPGSDEDFWNALHHIGLKRKPQATPQSWPGVTMTGPSAVDYILTSQPSLH